MATQVTNAILSTTGGLAAAGQEGIRTARERARTKADVLSKFGKTLSEIPSLLEEGRAEREEKSIADAVTAAKMHGTWDDAYTAAERIPTHTARGSAAKYKLALMVQDLKNRDETKKLDIAIKQREMADAERAASSADAEMAAIGGAFQDPNVDPTIAARRVAASGKIGVDGLSKVASFTNALARPEMQESKLEHDTWKELLKDKRARDLVDINRDGQIELAEKRAALADKQIAGQLERLQMTLKSREGIADKQIASREKATEARTAIDQERISLARDAQAIQSAMSERRLNVGAATALLREKATALRAASASARRYLAENGVSEDDEVYAELAGDVEEAERELDAIEAQVRNYTLYAPPQPAQGAAPASAPAPAPTSVDPAIKAAFDALPPAEQAKALEAMTPEERAKVGR